MDKHRNPDDTYDGIGVMSEISGLSKPDMLAIAEQVRTNHEKLAACKYHEFEQSPETASMRGRTNQRFVCKHCGGELSWHAHFWHEQGRRPRPSS